MVAAQSTRRILAALIVMLAGLLPMHAQKDKTMEQPVSYRTVTVDALNIFYREAGPKDAPTLLLLHGLPSSSRMFQSLLTRLSDSYYLPDTSRWIPRPTKLQV